MWRALDAVGITVLEDRAVKVGAFWIAGLGDMRHRMPNVVHALRAVPEDQPVIVPLRTTRTSSRASRSASR